jgi:predicted transcriptional regulator
MSTTITIRIADNLLETIEQDADKQDRSRNYIINKILESNYDLADGDNLLTRCLSREKKRVS